MLDRSKAVVTIGVSEAKEIVEKFSSSEIEQVEVPVKIGGTTGHMKLKVGDLRKYTRHIDSK